MVAPIGRFNHSPCQFMLALKKSVHGAPPAIVTKIEEFLRKK